MGKFLGTLPLRNRCADISGYIGSSQWACAYSWVHWLQAIGLGLFLCILAADNRPGPIPWSERIPWYIGTRQ